MVRACHTPWQPLQNHPSGTLEDGGRRVRQRTIMLDRQCQKVDIPALAKTAHNVLLHQRQEDLCWIVPHVPLTAQSGSGLNWSERHSFWNVSLFNAPLTAMVIFGRSSSVQFILVAMCSGKCVEFVFSLHIEKKNLLERYFVPHVHRRSRDRDWKIEICVFKGPVDFISNLVNEFCHWRSIGSGEQSIGVMAHQ